MAKKDTDFEQPQDVSETAVPPVAVLYGNENYEPRKPRAGTKHTQEEWLLEATEAKAVLERGDHVSPELIESLFLDAYDVIAAYVPPASRAKKDDEKRRES